jgi:hypothetical protein
MSIRRSIQQFALFALVSGAIHPATAAELLTNGGFETGNFTGWTVVQRGASNNNWFVVDAPQGPVSFNPTAGPASGSWYAVTDQTGPGAQVLSQSFSVPIGVRSLVVSFSLFANDWSGSGPVFGPGLDHSRFLEEGGGLVSNQHARVDLMAAVPDPFDVDAGVMATGYLGVDAGLPPHGWQRYTFDIMPYVLPGGAYVLRFAEVDNLGHFNMGVDDVSITATVPEPATWASMLVGGLAVAAVWCQQRRAGRRQPTMAA